VNRPDDDLILHYYGEHGAPEELERDLARDPELARRFAALKRELAALDVLTPPPPRPGIEARMWARVAPWLARPKRSFWFPSRLGWAGIVSSVGVVVVAVAAFFAGRALPLKALPPAARERVLEAALADHLESSQRLLLELANGASSFDEAHASAAILLSANRLYRGAAERAGKRRVAAVLAELESMLTELAEAPETSGQPLARAQAESEDLLFKVRIARNNLKRSS
jgi:hypothetical protein